MVIEMKNEKNIHQYFLKIGILPIFKTVFRDYNSKKMKNYSLKIILEILEAWERIHNNQFSS
jgi:hypothetical protein